MPPATDSAREKAWFVAYGVLATIYRAVIVVGIVLFIASKLFFVGVAMAAAVAVLWVVAPLAKALKYILFDKAIRPVRARAVGVSLIGAGAAAVLLGVLPAPTSVRAPCALEPYEQRVMRAEWPGFLSQVHVKDGQQVKEGQLMAVMANEELDFGIVGLRQKIEESAARLRLLETRRQAEAQAEAYHLEMLRKDLDLMLARKASMTVKALFDGQVIAPELERTKGRFLRLGEPLFTVASLHKLRVVAVVSDADVAAIRKAQDRTVRIKFASAPGKVCLGAVDRVHPSASHAAPPPGLTNAAGGQVLLDPKSREGVRTLLPWYRVDLVLEGTPQGLPVGVTGSARFVVGRDPIGKQLWLRFRRLLRRRFLI